jgi:hypothetical protein
MATKKYAYLVCRDYHEDVYSVGASTSLDRAIQKAKDLHASGQPSGNSICFGDGDVCASWQPTGFDSDVIQCQGSFPVGAPLGESRQRDCSVKIERHQLT